MPPRPFRHPPGVHRACRSGSFRLTRPASTTPARRRLSVLPAMPSAHSENCALDGKPPATDRPIVSVPNKRKAALRIAGAPVGTPMRTRASQGITVDTLLVDRPSAFVWRVSSWPFTRASVIGRRPKVSIHFGSAFPSPSKDKRNRLAEMAKISLAAILGCTIFKFVQTMR